jgi:hypothetical protein
VVEVLLFEVQVKILIAGSMLLFSCLSVALARHSAHLSTKFDQIVTYLSSPSPVSIGDISRGDRATTLVLISSGPASVA